MKVKCEYCGSMIEDTCEICPNCGSTNTNIKRTANNTPKTIEELKQWYRARNLPPYETTRFFIGIDYQFPRAFGIYQDGNEFVVYKNKDDGSRAVRYRGTDEAYAVNELFLKLKSEIINQKAHNRSKKNQRLNQATSRGSRMFTIYMICIILIPIMVIIYGLSSGPKPTYYKYNDTVYCEYNDNYYQYDEEEKDYYYISESALPKGITGENSEYLFDGSDIEWDSDYSFTDSNYYEENLKPKSSDNDDSNYDSNDSDYDWDSGSDWDSGGSDWNSDW